MFVQSAHFKRRFVISDIHGCSKTLKKILKKISLTKRDAIFFLGDLINRGPDSSGVLDILLNLTEKNYNVYFVRGNHEENILNKVLNNNPEISTEIKRNDKKSTIFNNNGSLVQKYQELITKSYYYIELEDFLLVHAGFDFTKEDFFNDYKSMLEIRFWNYDITKTHGKRVVHGHQPTYLDEIKKAVAKKGPRIPIDNGCVYVFPHVNHNYKKLGKLCCLELNSMKLYIQKNKDFN